MQKRLIGEKDLHSFPTRRSPDLFNLWYKWLEYTPHTNRTRVDVLCRNVSRVLFVHSGSFVGSYQIPWQRILQQLVLQELPN